MDMIFASRLLMILLIVVAMIFILAPEEEKKINSNSFIGKTSFKEVQSELSDMIALYVNNFIYKNQLSGDDIYIDDGKRTEISINLATEILYSMSSSFRTKANMYLSNKAIDQYVTVEVTKIILAYSHKVNSPKKSSS